MTEQDEGLLIPEDIVPYLKAKYPHLYRGNDEGWCRMRESALLLLLKNYDTELLLDAQQAHTLKRFKKALEQSRKGEPLDLSEEEFELFSAIQNDGVTKNNQKIEELFKEIDAGLELYLSLYVQEPMTYIKIPLKEWRLWEQTLKDKYGVK